MVACQPLGWEVAGALAVMGKLWQAIAGVSTKGEALVSAGNSARPGVSTCHFFRQQFGGGLPALGL